MLAFGGGRLETQVMLCAGRLPYFILGVCATMQEALLIKNEIKQFLSSELKLKLSDEKTTVINLSDQKSIFLGYSFHKQSGYKSVAIRKATIEGRRTTRRTTSGIISLRIPKEKTSQFVSLKRYGDLSHFFAKARTELIYMTDFEILMTYNAELRGFANYYSLADNFHNLSAVFYLARLSFFKTLAGKYKTTVKKIAKKLQSVDEYVVRRNNKEYPLVRLKHINRNGPLTTPNIDLVSNTWKYGTITELEKRMSAGECEACGTTDGPFEVHHVRKLKDLKKKPHLTFLDRLMIARKRKTLVLCTHCHKTHHQKQVPLDQLESRTK